MLTHTKKIKIIYERIQRKIYYMIPEKWEKLYLYCSLVNTNEQKGELYFYYIPKGLLKKTPVNVYEVPSKFNINEKDYIELVATLYDEFKNLRDEFKERELFGMWSNLSIVMDNGNFEVEYFYENLQGTDEENEERHIMWRYKYLGEYFKYWSKREKELIQTYLNGPKEICKKEVYHERIYIGNIRNIVEYDTYNGVGDEVNELKSLKLRRTPKNENDINDESNENKENKKNRGKEKIEKTILKKQIFKQPFKNMKKEKKQEDEDECEIVIKNPLLAIDDDKK